MQRQQLSRGVDSIFESPDGLCSDSKLGTALRCSQAASTVFEAYCVDMKGCTVCSWLKGVSQEPRAWLG